MIKRSGLIPLLLIPLSLFGAGFPAAPSAGYYVVDEDRLISSKYEEYINALSREVDQVTSVSMTVLIISSTGDEDISVYADNLAGKWFAGGAERDKGLVIVIAKDDHRVATNVGKDLEDVITTARIRRTRKNILIPNFKRSEYGRGVYWAMREYAKEVEKAYDVDFENLSESPGYDDELDDLFDGCWACWRVTTCLRWYIWWERCRHHNHHRHHYGCWW